MFFLYLIYLGRPMRILNFLNSPWFCPINLCWTGVFVPKDPSAPLLFLIAFLGVGLLAGAVFPCPSQYGASDRLACATADLMWEAPGRGVHVHGSRHLLTFCPLGASRCLTLVLALHCPLAHSCGSFRHLCHPCRQKSQDVGRGRAQWLLPNLMLLFKRGCMHTTSVFPRVTYCRCWMYLSLCKHILLLVRLLLGIRNVLWLLQGMSSNCFHLSLITSLDITGCPVLMARLAESPSSAGARECLEVSVNF